MSSETQAPAQGRSVRLTLTLLAVLALLVMAGGAMVRSSNAAKLQERSDEMAVPTVAVLSPGHVKAAATLDLPGRIEAFAKAPLYARVSGYLKSWSADIGTPVKAGQVLAEIETPDLDQQLLQAQAELGTARANSTQAAATAKRWQSLQNTDSVSRQEVEEKTSELSAKQAVVNAMQANVDRLLATKRFARIVAPFDGVVTARNTDVGALINVGSLPGTELFVVSDVRKLRIYVSVPQSYAASIKRGGKARLTVPERPGQTYTATVQASAQAINNASGSMLVQLAADNAAADLLPGGFVNVSLDLPGNTDALSIPPSALIFDKAGLRVAVVDADSKVQIKPVQIARDLGSSIELASGLNAVDRVIDSPPDGIAQGDSVRVLAPTAKGKT